MDYRGNNDINPFTLLSYILFCVMFVVQCSSSWMILLGHYASLHETPHWSANCRDDKWCTTNIALPDTEKSENKLCEINGGSENAIYNNKRIPIYITKVYNIVNAAVERSEDRWTVGKWPWRGTINWKSDRFRNILFLYFFLLQLPNDVTRSLATAVNIILLLLSACAAHNVFRDGRDGINEIS